MIIKSHLIDSHITIYLCQYHLNLIIYKIDKCDCFRFTYHKILVTKQE